MLEKDIREIPGRIIEKSREMIPVRILHNLNSVAKNRSEIRGIPEGFSKTVLRGVFETIDES